MSCRSGQPLDYCVFNFPNGQKFRTGFGPKDGFDDFETSLPEGRCGITILRAEASYSGQVKCNLGVSGAGDEFQGVIEMVIGGNST